MSSTAPHPSESSDTGTDSSTRKPEDEACLFVQEHSEVFKVQRQGDDSATATGCFPPPAMIPHARVIQLLLVLKALHHEVNTAPTEDPYRIFRVRDTPFYESLRSCTAAEDTADLTTVADYLQLPKALIVAIERHVAIDALVGRYNAAAASYAFASSFEPRPRLWEHLLADPTTKPLVDAAMKTMCPTLCRQHKKLDDGIACEEPNTTYYQAAVSKRGFEDGLVCEALSEFGYTPGPQRVLAYAAAFVVMGRPVPFDSLPEGYWRKFNNQHQDLDPAIVAATLGKLDVLQELHEKGWDMRTHGQFLAYSAARHGRLEVLQWLRSLYPYLIVLDEPSRLVAAALTGRHVKVAQWLVTVLEDPLSEDRRSLFVRAVAADDIPLAKRLLRHAPLETSAAEAACRNGNLAMLEWLVSEGCMLGSSCVNAALQGGHWNVFQWCLVKGCRLRHEALAAACEGFRGDLDRIQALIDMGAPMDTLAIKELAGAAGRIGNLSILQWMHARGSFADENIFLNALQKAMESSNVECADWLLKVAAPALFTNYGARLVLLHAGSRPAAVELLERVMPPAPEKDAGQSRMFDGAMDHVNVDAARMLLRKGCKVGDYSEPLYPFDSMITLLERGDEALPLVRCLVEEGGLRFENMTQVVMFTYYGIAATVAARSGSRALLEYVVENGSEVTEAVCAAAACKGHLPLLRWIRANKPSWRVPYELVDLAHRSGQDEVVQWALDSASVDTRRP